MNFLDAKLAAFFAGYDFDVGGPDVEAMSKSLFYDLHSGLEKCENNFTQEMLPTWIRVQNPTDKRIIVLDAGGTNFRSYLIEIKNGYAKILKSKVGELPATKSNLTKNEFFEAIADSIEYLKNSAEKISFCFAYALKMTSEKDAVVLRMSKQIKVEGIIGALVGESLFEVLKKRGWVNLQKVSVVNDTVAALLSGLSLGKNFSSYIGMILGTGFNIAYEESEPIKKLKTDEQLLEQIIVCETAKTNKIVSSNFDVQLRESTFDKNICKLEKMCGGAYLGDLISIAIRQACYDKIFSENVSATFQNCTFDFKTINEFLLGEKNSENKISSLLKESSATEDDVYLLKQITLQFINRTARIITSALISVALKTKKGLDSKKPICIVTEGTTFRKTYRLKDMVEKLLYEHLTKKYSIYFELHSIENAVAIGTAYFS